MREDSSAAATEFPDRIKSAIGLGRQPLRFECSDGMFEDGLDLLFCDAGKPRQKVIDRCARFKVLEQGGYRYARAAKYPGTADPSRVLLDFRACRPFDHRKQYIASIAGGNTIPKSELKSKPLDSLVYFIA